MGEGERGRNLAVFLSSVESYKERDGSPVLMGISSAYYF
jgi:hypothetical protein